MRTFTFREGSSDKFWNIELKGKSFTVHFGRQGTKGQTQTKEFTDEARAQKEHDKLIKQKLAKGYTETTPAAAPAMTPLRGVLEAAIIAGPHDRAAYMAYADYLQEEGDPQGEFIQVQLRLEDESLPTAERKKLQARERQLLAEHQDEWVGEWAMLIEPEAPFGRGQIDTAGGVTFRFERGCLAEVYLPCLGATCARSFVRSPQTRLVRKLFVGTNHYKDDGGIDELRNWPHLGSLRFFQIGWTSDEEYGDFCHFQCHTSVSSVSAFVTKMPLLEELYVFAWGVEDLGKLFALPLPNLRVLQVYHNWDHPLAKLAKNASLGKLTHLLLHPKAAGSWSDDLPYIKDDDVQAVLRSPHLTSLTHLRLRLTTFGDAGCREIVKSGILKRLKVLDLRHGRISDDGARVLMACPELKNLEHLDLSRNELSRKGIQALKALGISLDAKHQHESTAEDEVDDMEFLMEGDYE
jgi:uncharacterized protein (TIGR02996 family)